MYTANNVQRGQRRVRISSEFYIGEKRQHSSVHICLSTDSSGRVSETIGQKRSERAFSLQFRELIIIDVTIFGGVFLFWFCCKCVHRLVRRLFWTTDKYTQFLQVERTDQHSHRAKVVAECSTRRVLRGSLERDKNIGTAFGSLLRLHPMHVAFVIGWNAQQHIRVYAFACTYIYVAH